MPRILFTKKLVLRMSLAYEGLFYKHVIFATLFTSQNVALLTCEALVARYKILFSLIHIFFKVETAGKRRMRFNEFILLSHCEFFYFSRISTSRQTVFAMFFRRFWIDKLQCCLQHKICRVRFCG